MTPICLVGIGKIAVDQHVPAINGSEDWELAATVSRAGTVDGVQSFTDFDQMLAERTDIAVISLCLPPVPRYDYAAKAIAAGRHVMLEKPPGATLAEVDALVAMAKAAGVTLYTTWHSRMAKGVAPAKAWLADKQVTSAHINWKEDVRRWHPNQEWVFAPGGMGVFDPGSNALSIITEILPMPIHLRSADLHFPANRDTPIAAQLQWTKNVSGDFDWRQEGPQSWDITVETTAGTLNLHDGGDRLIIDGQEIAAGNNREYPSLYDRMAELVKTGASDVDVSPMIHVADALTLGKRIMVDPFHF
ncbi:Gfo/Idh/MocA family oxidoreductase [Yoonia sp. F2084L]|uniref:Gfo/Idh/MocA family protein n=1 Tax=Yoonia sp. F2084L TaxID=2926419 RepID=UPI001FF38377|nr:Gfo/Idh/MocA family oxidoreductase [Yoonia sp. F2084L]MCK0095680.1 Gfo/Idh/MocA family oxidoreductase [Yoonia sp. F2084L]